MATIDDFEILSRLGSGSFGTVYKVRRIEDNNTYVIKCVRIVDLSYKEQSEAINEVRILSQMNSTYVVQYYDSFISEDSLHIVMEYCNKGDLQNLLKKAKEKEMTCLKEHVTWNISLQIILGLYYLHKKKILHRDLKTANVFLMKDSSKPYFSVKIGDLGVAKLLETSTMFAQTIVGTPYYLSPELCNDKPYRDKSDCWALGVLIYECCTLRHPFDARNQCALILKIIQAKVEPPPSTTTSDELCNVVMWLLQKDPMDRPSTKDLLNEQIIREKLIEHDLELPEDLIDSPITNRLGTSSRESYNDSDSQNRTLVESLASDSKLDKTDTESKLETNLIIVEQADFKHEAIDSIDKVKDNDFSGDVTVQTGSKPNKWEALRVPNLVPVQKNKPITAVGGVVIEEKPERINVPFGPGRKVHPTRSSVPGSSTTPVKLLTSSSVQGNRVRGPGAKRIMSEKALMRHQVKTSKTIDIADSKFSNEEHSSVDNKLSPPSSLSPDNLDESSHASDNDTIQEDSLTNSSNLKASKISFTIDISDELAESKHEFNDIDVTNKVSDDNEDEDYYDDYDYEDDFEEYEGDDAKHSLRRTSSNKENKLTPESKNEEKLNELDETLHWNISSDDDHNAHNSSKLSKLSDSGKGDIRTDTVHFSYSEENPDYISQDYSSSSDSLDDLIREARNRAISSVGEESFTIIYDLCKKHMVSDTKEDDANPIKQDEMLFVKELEKSFPSKKIGLESACQAVFSIKVLLALEFKRDSSDEQDNRK